MAWGQRVRVVGLAVAVLLGVAGCRDGSSEGASSSTTTSVPASTTTTTSPPPPGPCYENVSLGAVFTQEMVDGCLRLSGIATATCADGAALGLVDVVGSPYVVRAGVPAERAEDDLARRIGSAPPPEYEVDDGLLQARCP